MISTESHTPKSTCKEINKITEREICIDTKKNGIFQEMSKADQFFYFKWKVRVFLLQGILTHPEPPI